MGKNELNLVINRSHMRTGLMCISFNGGGSLNLKSSSFNSGSGGSNIVLVKGQIQQKLISTQFTIAYLIKPIQPLVA